METEGHHANSENKVHPGRLRPRGQIREIEWIPFPRSIGPRLQDMHLYAPDLLLKEFEKYKSSSGRKPIEVRMNLYLCRSC
jgi:hypothetical protein